MQQEAKVLFKATMLLHLRSLLIEEPVQHSESTLLKLNPCNHRYRSTSTMSAATGLEAAINTQSCTQRCQETLTKSLGSGGLKSKIFQQAPCVPLNCRRPRDAQENKFAPHGATICQPVHHSKVARADFAPRQTPASSISCHLFRSHEAFCR